MAKTKKRPGKHYRNVKTKKGRKRILINPEVKPAVANRVFKHKLQEAQIELKKKGRIRLPELGILSIKIKPAKKARMGINPFTKEKMMFKAKPRTKVVKFRAAKALKECLN